MLPTQLLKFSLIADALRFMFSLFSQDLSVCVTARHPFCASVPCSPYPPSFALRGRLSMLQDSSFLSTSRRFPLLPEQGSLFSRRRLLLRGELLLMLSLLCGLKRETLSSDLSGEGMLCRIMELPCAVPSKMLKDRLYSVDLFSESLLCMGAHKCEVNNGHYRYARKRSFQRVCHNPVD